MAYNPLIIGRRPVTPVPRGRLLDVLSRFDVPGNVSDRWLGGVTWTPTECLDLLLTDVEVCNRVDLTDNPRDCVAPITQSAFNVYDAFQGSTLEYTREEIEEEITYRMPTLVSAAFATELISGATSGGRGLADDAHAPTEAAFGTVLPVWQALAALESDLARTIGGAQGVIHLPPGMLAQGVTEYGFRLENGQYETPLGHKVVADAGYVDAAAPNGQVASGAGEDWVYASGPVEYQMTEPMTINGPEMASGFDRTRNTLTMFREVAGILVFDPCPVVAVLATYDKTV